ILALTLSELFSRGFSVEKSAILALFVICAIGAACLFTYGRIHHVNPLVEVREQLLATVETFTKSAGTGSDQSWLGTADPEEWKAAFLLQVPSAIAVFLLILVWVNSTI